MSRFITAEQARTLATKVNENGCVVPYDCIEDAAAKGMTHCFIDFILSPTTRSNFQAKGFTVEDLDPIVAQKDGLYHKISW